MALYFTKNVKLPLVYLLITGNYGEIVHVELAMDRTVRHYDLLSHSCWLLLLTNQKGQFLLFLESFNLFFPMWCLFLGLI